MTQPPTTPPGGIQYQVPPTGGGNGLAIASLILGILACVTFCFAPVSGLLAVLAIVFGVIAMGKPVGGGMAKSGLVLGVVGISLTLGFYIAVKAGLNWAGKKVQQNSQDWQKQLDEAAKKIQEEQKKAQEQMQRQNQTSQPGVILVHPSGWMLVLD
ncbi:MAG TPA: hypothetical protein VK797_03875 [Tepidisphaeraceae bacterium]|jgi:hypothetical protein|nr:hypothetical protein [Tepidisphaeraceae bacterium]